MRCVIENAVSKEFLIIEKSMHSGLYACWDKVIPFAEIIQKLTKVNNPQCLYFTFLEQKNITLYNLNYSKAKDQDLKNYLQNGIIQEKVV